MVYEDEADAYSPSVDPGIVQAIYDYDGRWPIPTDTSIEDDYSEESFA